MAKHGLLLSKGRGFHRVTQLAQPRTAASHHLHSHEQQHSFTAQLGQPRETPHTHVPSGHQHWHCKASIITQTLLTRDVHSGGTFQHSPLHCHRQ